MTTKDKSSFADGSTHSSRHHLPSELSITINESGACENELDQFPVLKELLTKAYPDPKDDIQLLYHSLKNAGLMRSYKNLDHPCFLSSTHPLDLGRASKYKVPFDEVAADKIFTIPKTDQRKLIIPYNECSPSFNTKFLTANKRPWLEQHLVELQNTVAESTSILAPLRGRVVKYDMVMLLLVVVVLPIIAILSIVCGIRLSYWITVGLLLSFMLLIAIYLSITKMKSRSYLKWSTLCLAFYLRTENNRYYIENGILLRPGSMGKWIEVCPLR
jgi:hypothetical protein